VIWLAQRWSFQHGWVLAIRLEQPAVCVTYVTCFSRLHTAGARPAGRPDVTPFESTRDSTSSSAMSGPVPGNSPRALADDHRDDKQSHLVDQVVGEQPPDQGAAAVHLHLTRRLGLQLADAAARSPDRTVVSSQRGAVSVVDARTWASHSTPRRWVARISSIAPQEPANSS